MTPADRMRPVLTVAGWSALGTIAGGLLGGFAPTGFALGALAGFALGAFDWWLARRRTGGRLTATDPTPPPRPPDSWSPLTPPVTAAEFPGVLATRPAVVVYFYAQWNVVDRQFSPTLDAVRPEFAGRIEFRSVDVDLEPQFCAEWGVVNLPFLVCFVGGKRVKTLAGGRAAEELRQEFAVLG